jgi:hypothetical protein
MREVHKKLGQDVIKPCDINWVLTVPAILSDAAKQFMREAAVITPTLVVFQLYCGDMQI